jgi:hypothetical protein
MEHPLGCSVSGPEKCRFMVRPSVRKPTPDELTVHQVVAHNVYQARRLRGWTQEEAAIQISNTLGRR